MLPPYDLSVVSGAALEPLRSRERSQLFVIFFLLGSRQINAYDGLLLTSLSQLIGDVKRSFLVFRQPESGIQKSQVTND